ncbi:hypothetical protein MCEREM21A_02354 [Sphingomonadaceae bacterium]
MAKGKGNRPNATGRNRTSRFLRLDHSIFISSAYRALSSTARALLFEIISLYNGQNNGALYLSVRDAAARLGLADLGAASRAFDELEAMGFIVCTVEGYFSVKTANQSRARRWRLTFEAGPGRKGPTMEFQKREPCAQTQARKRMERGLRALKTYRRQRDAGKLPVLDSRTNDPFSGCFSSAAVSESRTLNDESCSFPTKCIVSEFDTYTATTMGRDIKVSRYGCSKSDGGSEIETPGKAQRT